MEADFTPQESLLVVDEALRLLDTPETFTQGTWKCPVYEAGTIGKVKKDRHGRTTYAYCIEGAVNQACINVLGEPRAVELGALAKKTGEGEDMPSDLLRGGQATELLSLNQLADKLFHSVIESGRDQYMEDEQERAAQMVNDFEFENEVEGESEKERLAVVATRKMIAYERVTTLLRRKRDALRAALGVQS